MEHPTKTQPSALRALIRTADKRLCSPQRKTRLKYIQLNKIRTKHTVIFKTLSTEDTRQYQDLKKASNYSAGTKFIAKITTITNL